VIVGYVGRVGHGKTMRMVVDGINLAARRKSRPVLASNIRINVPPELDVEFVQLAMAHDGLEFPDGAPLDELFERYRDRGCVLLVDEVHMIWGAREWSDMGKVARYRLTQSRKLGTDVLWTAQFVDQVEKNIRELTETVELMRAHPAPTLERREAGKRPWVLFGNGFRPGHAESANPDKRLWRNIYRYRRAHELLYDTDELVVPASKPEAAVGGRRRRGSRHAGSDAVQAAPTVLSAEPSPR